MDSEIETQLKKVLPKKKTYVTEFTQYLGKKNTYEEEEICE